MLRCAPKKSIKKPRKAASGQKEMLMPVECKKQANEMAARKTGPVPSAGLHGAVSWWDQLWEHLCLRLLLTKKSR